MAMHDKMNTFEKPMIVVLSDDYRFSAGLQKNLLKLGLSPIGFSEIASAVQYEEAHKQVKKLIVLDATSKNTGWLDVLNYFCKQDAGANCIALLPDNFFQRHNHGIRNLRAAFPKNETVCAMLPDYISKSIEIMETEDQMHPFDSRFDATPDQELSDTLLTDVRLPAKLEDDHITGLKNHETKKQNEEARSAFLASLSNELLNPLSIISSSIEILKQTQLDAQQSQNLECINDSTESLQRIVNSLLNALGGYFAGENRLGRHIDTMLDIDTNSNPGQLATDHELECLANKRKDLRILFAEDDAINQLYLAAFMRSQGWMVDTAYNGRAALDKFEAGKYDLIILDGQMPEMDGFETARKIREAEDADTHTPILAISGYAIPGDKERFISSGMDEYLPKPVSETMLLKMIFQLTG